MASSKRAASDAHQALENAIGSIPDVGERRTATLALATMNRFIGELRRERATAKSELENRPTKATKERLDASRQTVDELKLELERSDQKLRSAEGALRSRELADTPQAHLGRLVKGVDQPKSTAKDERQRCQQLRRLVPTYLADFVKAANDNEVDTLTIHQDAFAAGFHADEFTLLGMAVKYLGEFGMPITIFGTNGDTCHGSTVLSQQSQIDDQVRRCHAVNTPVTRQSEPVLDRHWLLRLLSPRTGK